jgi:hypothetical protein
MRTALGGQPRKDASPKPSRVVENMSDRFGYEKVLTARERDFILMRTYALARRLGYFTGADEVHLPGRIGLAAKWFLPDKWELMNARSRLRQGRAMLRRRGYIYRKLLLPFPG